MPYDLDNPPEKLRGLPMSKQRQWIHVYRSCMEKYGDDIKCQKMAWGVTHGWRTEKGFDPEDPDRDLDLEGELVIEEFVGKARNIEMEEKISGRLREKIEIVD